MRKFLILLCAALIAASLFAACDLGLGTSSGSSRDSRQTDTSNVVSEYQVELE
ncbi:MAG: hypothetical protein QHH01_06725 [Spirochaetales bacterium]|nr:hypothetical protein [Spirochaetales bacterium]